MKWIARVWPYALIAISVIGLVYMALAGRFWFFAICYGLGHSWCNIPYHSLTQPGQFSTSVMV